MLANIPKEFADEYNLMVVIDQNNWVYLEIRKGVYGLPEAGKLANESGNLSCVSSSWTIFGIKYVG